MLDETMPDWMRRGIVDRGEEQGITWITSRMERGHINGYVYIPEGHPYRGRNTIQWAPNGILNAVPGEILRLLSEDGKTFGYAPSEGWSFTFYHPSGDVKVEPGQWVTRYDDGTIAVSDDPRITDAPTFPSALFGESKRGNVHTEKER